MFIKNVRLGKDAELATTKAGKPMLKMACAYDSGWGENKKTVWINAVKWGDKNDGILPYLKKGAVIELVCDDIYPEAYTAKDGSLKSSLTGNVIRIGLVPLPSAGAGNSSTSGAGSNRPTTQPVASAPSPEPEFDDDIPF